MYYVLQTIFVYKTYKIYYYIHKFLFVKYSKRCYLLHSRRWEAIRWDIDQKEADSTRLSGKTSFIDLHAITSVKLWGKSRRRVRRMNATWSRSPYRPLVATQNDVRSSRMPFASDAEVLWANTYAGRVADAMIEATFCA